jgi:hypothetical protein
MGEDLNDMFIALIIATLLYVVLQLLRMGGMQ